MQLFGKKQVKETEIENPLAKKQEEVRKILAKYPDRVPVIIERAHTSRNSIGEINDKQYLVPEMMTFGQFIRLIRKRIKLDPDKALYLYVKNVQPPVTHTMGQIYQDHKDESHFLLATYAAESTFGK